MTAAGAQPVRGRDLNQLKKLGVNFDRLPLETLGRIIHTKFALLKNQKAVQYSLIWSSECCMFYG